MPVSTRQSEWLRFPYRSASLLASLGLTFSIAGCQPDSGSTAQKSAAATATSPAQTGGLEPETSSQAAPPAAPEIVDQEALDESGRIVLESTRPPLSVPEPDPVTVEAATANAADSAEASAKIVASSSPAAPQAEALESDMAEGAPVVEVEVAEISASSPDTPAVATEVEQPAEEEAEVAELPAKVAAPAPFPAEANVTSASERDQRIAADWPQPQAVLYVSGQQHGYIEPCGCTGLENQKGGLIRRDTLLTELRGRGWDLVPVDVGNQVRRTGRQPELKFQSTVEAFKTMGYQAVTLGIDDLKLSSIELIQLAGSDGLNATPFISANASVIDSSFFPSHRIVEVGGRKIGITGAIGNSLKEEIQSSDIELSDAAESLKPVVELLQKQGCDFLVLLAHAPVEESAEIARQVPGFDLVVTAGGYGEPTLHPEEIPGSEAVMVQVGTKGMYGGIIGLFEDATTPIRYQKIAISSQFKDSDRMLLEFERYQQRLKDAGFDGLGVAPIAHPTGRQYVGSEVCGECHTQAYEIWENSPHVHATDSIIAASNDRGGITRQHDPECISCHATGWNPQKFYPYQTGFISAEKTPLLVGSGCENCHGPGKSHVDAEYGDIETDNELLLELRRQMVLPLAQAREKCLECHDLDNSPDFHTAPFEEYWDQIKHYGKD
ncbi:multiheme c-type cytochrome [Aureliella helgolandensis]|uniref:multiheme c-type cytochrome n=1 Tax=Aureliella helgolandensis TaxID=2527968 RepID=UPI0018D0311F|nr:multiheme c-type cytochrome [Aureliella helgolandensis]